MSNSNPNEKIAEHILEYTIRLKREDQDKSARECRVREIAAREKRQLEKQEVGQSPRKRFTECSARFSGTGNKYNVEEFVNVTTIFKSIEGISDEDAIQGLPLLLTDKAATWWHGVRSTATTWDGAVELIRKQYAPQKPAYKIYQELFDDRQADNETIDMYVARKRALLSQIKPVDAATTELDLVYALLNLNVRQHVHRQNINNFDDLLAKARAVEEIKAEKAAVSKQTNYLPSSKHTKQPTMHLRCGFCGVRGHGEDVCRRKASTKNLVPAISMVQSTSANAKQTVSCYGCGAPDIVKSACTKCSNQPPANIENFEFYSINPKLGSEVPTIKVTVNGVLGVAHIDTGARTSIASRKLYEKMILNGCTFSKIAASVVLADGSCRQQDILTIMAKIELEGRKFDIRITALPNAVDNRTLLGIDFLEKALIILNIPQRSWCFADQPFSKWYSYITLPPQQPNEVTQILSISNKKTKRKRKRYHHRKNKSNNPNVKTTLPHLPPSCREAVVERIEPIASKHPEYMETRKSSKRRKNRRYTPNEGEIARIFKQSKTPECQSPNGSTSTNVGGSKAISKHLYTSQLPTSVSPVEILLDILSLSLYSVNIYAPMK